MVAVLDEDGTANGFLYTVGLWRTYQHPEILLLSPQWDPQGMAGPLTALVERIAAQNPIRRITKRGRWRITSITQRQTPGA